MISLRNLSFYVSFNSYDTWMCIVKLPFIVILLPCLKGIFYLPVPIGVIASFRKMKKLTRDMSLIVAALKESSLVVSDCFL